VASVHVMLRRAFRDATAWRYINTNPVAAAEPPRVDTGEHRTWTPTQLTTFLELARHDRLYAMWLLLATTGVRRSEVAGVRRDALDPVNATITITTTRVIAAGKAQASSGKTRRSRRLLALDTATMRALTEHLATVE
jgi:integrase